jgi:hypothetical protein
VHGQVWGEGVEEGRERDAEAEEGHAAQQLRQEGDEQEAGSGDRPVRSPAGGRQGAGPDVQQEEQHVGPEEQQEEGQARGLAQEIDAGVRTVQNTETMRRE